MWERRTYNGDAYYEHPFQKWLPYMDILVLCSKMTEHATLLEDFFSTLLI